MKLPGHIYSTHACPKQRPGLVSQAKDGEAESDSVNGCPGRNFRWEFGIVFRMQEASIYYGSPDVAVKFALSGIKGGVHMQGSQVVTVLLSIGSFTKKRV